MADSIETDFRLKLPSHFEANALFEEPSYAIIVGEEIDLCLIAKQLDGPRDIWKNAVSNVRAAVSVVDAQGNRPPDESFDCKVIKSTRGRDKRRKSPPKSLDSPDTQIWKKLKDNTMSLTVPVQFIPDSKTRNESYKIFVALWSTDGAESRLELSTHKLMSSALNVQFPPTITSKVVHFSGRTFARVGLRNQTKQTIAINSLKIFLAAEKEDEISIDHTPLPTFPVNINRDSEYSFLIQIIDNIDETVNKSQCSSKTTLIAEVNWEADDALDKIITTYT